MKAMENRERGSAGQHQGAAMKKGWPVKRLGEVCEIIMGQSPDGESYNTTGEGVPLINGPVEFSAESFGKTVRTKFTTQPTKFCKEGDLILCVRGSTTGRMNIAGFDACVGRGVAAIRAKQYQPWINHFISSKRDEIHGKGTGATFPNVSGDSLASFELVVPPLAEQQRIVGLLDEAFEGLATAKANAEKNLQNARALFESHLQSVFTQRGPGWVEKTLGDVFTTATGTTPPKNNAEFYGDFMPLVKPPELCDEAFDSAPDGLSEAGAAVARTLPTKSILVSCIGNLGKIGLNTVPVAFNQQINAILPDETQAIPEFMFLQSLAPVFKEQLESLASGTTVPIVNKSKFNSVRVVLPPLPIQKPVVAQLTALREETQRLARLYERKRAALEALKKSLLHQAFTGEL
jgi:type I restriction enzyme S subunit